MVDVNLEGISISRTPRKSGIRYVGPIGMDATTPSPVNSGGTSSPGLSSKAARQDHTHGLTLASSAPPVVASSGASVVGTATTPARSDHTHGVDLVSLAAALNVTAASAAPPLVAAGSTSAVGSSDNLARQDHTHGLTLASSAPPAIVEGASVLGSATTPARSDHTHGTSTLARETGTLVSGNMGIATLSHTPINITNTLVSVNGQLLTPTAEYTVVSNVILATQALNISYGGSGSDGLGFSNTDTYVVTYKY